MEQKNAPLSWSSFVTSFDEAVSWRRGGGISTKNVAGRVNYTAYPVIVFSLCAAF